MGIRRSFSIGVLVGGLVVQGALFLNNQTPLLAQTTSDVSAEVDRIRDEIVDRNDRLKEIEAEIAKFQAELQKVGGEKNTLQKAINQLELERKKISSDISYTQNRIGATDLEIQKLNIEIDQTEDDIAENKNAIGEILRRSNEIDDTSMVETLLSHDNMSDFWATLDELAQVRDVLGSKVIDLAELQAILEEKVGENRVKRESLVDLKTQYEGQQEVLEVNKNEKNELLTKTKNEEANYQKLLAEKKAAQEQILKELRDFEAKLKFVLDPTTIPTAGTAVFRWPLESIRITQYFGGTEFAKQNASVYAGRPYHPGVDFGVPRGTKIMAPLAGVVRATGNTDAVPGCYSWGKWTLIDHANGLSTLYAHQDVISVSPGQSVGTGETIGFSGNTGYSTGPHLHFTVYAKEGVSVRKFSDIKTVTSCGAATTPVAAPDAYLDPMLYLPAA
jgi:murein DD-endopeptidase MepM/ murein hydrolase activator NlpD